MKTIGFGDMTPQVPWVRIVNSFFAIITPGITALAMKQLADAHMNWAGRMASRITSQDGSATSSMHTARVEQWIRRLSLISIPLLLLAGMFLFSAIEPAMPYADSYQLSLAIFTTVGYGDVVATTDACKIAVIVYSFITIGVAAVAIDVIADIVLERFKGSPRNKVD
jgi:Ion channel